MNELQNSASVVIFGAFEVNLQTREVRKHGLRIRLEEKPFRILEMLIGNAGRVVKRDALCAKLWPDTHVGFEHSLNTAVNKLRDLLGDSAQNPRFVETVPRLGYRFIAPVTRPAGSGGLTSKKLLVVLPFENLCGGQAEDVFADGLTEEMISHLGRLSPKRLGVIARTSAIQYKAPKKSIGKIAEELRVDYVLEGSVRCEGRRRVRITGQLIEAREQTHLWSASYNRELRDSLEVQSEVARQMGEALALQLFPQEPALSAAIDPSMPGRVR
ncbi:MAG TPA: winged helix-turn-helix domain-containing protein [Candidatus Angelobacter sp.]|nr:winged helix-turn-helix domain-containing protein [Candidatus Angelobacter sp.]